MVARPPPRTPGAVPAALPPVTVMSEVSAMPPSAEPSARPGSRRAASSSGAAFWSTALAMTVGTKGPGAMARPSSSTTTTSSGSPKPDPPLFSGRWRPSQPNSARSLQNAGRLSCSASSRDRAAPRASRLARKSEAVCPRARWSSVMAIGMAKSVSSFSSRPSPTSGRPEEPCIVTRSADKWGRPRRSPSVVAVDERSRGDALAVRPPLRCSRCRPPTTRPAVSACSWPRRRPCSSW